jgi:hypothetical protein
MLPFTSKKTKTHQELPDIEDVLLYLGNPYVNIFDALKSSKNKKFLGSFEVAKFSIKRNPDTYKLFNYEIRDNDEIIRLALSKDGLVLKDMCIVEQDNPDYVKLAIGNKTTAYAYASNRLKLDDEIVDYFAEKAIERKRLLPSNPIDFLSIPKSIFNKKPEILEKILNNNISFFQYSPEKYQSDQKWIDKALEKDPYLVKYVSKSLQSNKEFMLKVLQRSNIDRYNIAHIFNDFPKKFKEDFDFVSEVLRKNPKYIQTIFENPSVTPLHKQSLDFVLDTYPISLVSISAHHKFFEKYSYFSYCEKAIEIDPSLWTSFYNVGSEFKSNEEKIKLLKQAFQKDPLAFTIEYNANVSSPSYQQLIIKSFSHAFKKESQDYLISCLNNVGKISSENNSTGSIDNDLELISELFISDVFKSLLEGLSNESLDSFNESFNPDNEYLKIYGRYLKDEMLKRNVSLVDYSIKDSNKHKNDRKLKLGG